jgi:hypothetical protein
MQLRSIVPGAFILALMIGANAADASAQSACYTPQGEERRAILDALRRPVEGDLHQPTEFVITKFRVCWSGQPIWAFVDARPQRPGSAPIDWKSAGYEDCSWTVEGLLRKTRAGWQVVEHDVCPTDVPWSAWTDEYGAPPELFR